MSDLSLCTMERVEVALRGEQATILTGCGKKVLATRQSLSKSKVLQQTIQTAEKDIEVSLALPKGYLLAWLQWQETSQQEGGVERCIELPIPRIVTVLQVCFIRVCFLCGHCLQLHKRCREESRLQLHIPPARSIHRSAVDGTPAVS